MPNAWQSYVWIGTNDLALTKWQMNDEIKQMALGVYHSAFLTSQGRVLCCGQNSHGQLGIGTDEGTYMEPVKVELLHGVYNLVK